MWERKNLFDCETMSGINNMFRFAQYFIFSHVLQNICASSSRVIFEVFFVFKTYRKLFINYKTSFAWFYNYKSSWGRCCFKVLTERALHLVTSIYSKSKNGCFNYFAKLNIGYYFLCHIVCLLVEKKSEFIKPQTVYAICTQIVSV